MNHAPDADIPYAVDWNRHRAVVFEGDDWGSCEFARNRADADVLASMLETVAGAVVGIHLAGTLETPQDLNRLYGILAGARGADGQRAVFTAFVCVGNPDYAAVRASGFNAYADIGIDAGVPPGWERGDVVGAWRTGMAQGVFAPEFHSNLHHTSPELWLERLRAEGAKGDFARAAFERSVFTQTEHLPEFARMNVRRQADWVRTGVERFTRVTGYAPACAVTSDACPVTETVWSIHGIRTVGLKRCVDHDDRAIVYHSKPWNNQDRHSPMGAYNAVNDLVYLNRNVFFECASGAPDQLAEAVLPVIRRRWAANEPAVICTHRANYVSLNPAIPESGFRELASLLGALSRAGARFITSAELGDLYRNGWSVRRVGESRIVRKWSDDAGEIRLRPPVRSVTSLPDGKDMKAVGDGSDIVLTLPLGDYRVV